MTRVGQNPAKSIDRVEQPANVTVAVVNFIPMLSGYYEQALDVLKACLTSLFKSTPESHDVILFDNHSCKEVRKYLEEAYEQGIIQYLILSDKNIGKIGAWNFMFGAAQGEYVAFSDADILFRPGWLASSIEIFKTFPKVGMVTARPLRTPMQFSSSSLEWAESQSAGVFQKGQFMDWDTYIEHAYSLGYTEQRARTEFKAGTDYRITEKELIAFLGAAHFQFLTKKVILDDILPIPSEKPMRGERAFDIAINDRKFLRLGTKKPFVVHMGNTAPKTGAKVSPIRKKRSLTKKILWLPGIRHVLLALNNWIFKVYFYNID